VRFRRSDLNPQLGWPGGPCHVMDRIRREVRNPRLQENLVDDVEAAEKLTNPEAAKIYSIERDKGPAAKFMRRLEITPHAQYRMDLRGVTIADVRLSLGNFARAFYDAKSRSDFEYQRWAEDMAYGRPIRWEDPKNARLVIVFTAHGRGTVRIVTVYWEGMSDPRPIDESACRVASMCLLAGRVREALRIAPTPGVQTYVTDKSQKNLPTDVDREKQVNLPPGSATPGGAGRDIPQFSYNGPDSDSDIKPRTVGVPGEEYGHPSNDTYNTVTRRTMTSAHRVASAHKTPRILLRGLVRDVRPKDLRGSLVRTPFTGHSGDPILQTTEAFESPVAAYRAAEAQAKKYRMRNWPGGMATVVALAEFPDAGDSGLWVGVLNTYYSSS